jgi:hypothetical protein
MREDTSLLVEYSSALRPRMENGVCLSTEAKSFEVGISFVHVVRVIRITARIGCSSIQVTMHNRRKPQAVHE